MRARFAILLCCVVCLSGYPPGVGLDGCAGPECDQGRTTCDAGLSTSISGTVFAPNGTLPLPNVTVYVPKGPVQRFSPRSCDRCDRVLGGDPLVQTTSDVDGATPTTFPPAATFTGDPDRPMAAAAGRAERPGLGHARLAANEHAAKNPAGRHPRLAPSPAPRPRWKCLVRKVGLEPGTAAGRSSSLLGHRRAGRLQAGGAFASAPRIWRSLETLQLRPDLPLV